MTFDLGSPLPSSGMIIGRPAEPPTSWAVIVIAVSSLAIILAVGVLASQFR